MPGIDTECEGPGATHSHACKCREEYFRKIEEQLKEAVKVIEFYADFGSWQIHVSGTGQFGKVTAHRFEIHEVQGGDKAREFLATMEKIK